MAHQTVTLTYNFTAEGVDSSPDPIRVEVGDTVEFQCSQGPVHVLFLPAGHFSAEEFRTGDKPVQRLLGGSTKVCCGVVTGGQIFGYPLHQRFGHQLEPDSLA